MCDIFDCSLDYLIGKSKQKNMQFPEFENIKNYYEKKFNNTLENKYFNEFRELGLAVYEIETLLMSIDVKGEFSQEQCHTLLISILSIIELKYNEHILNSVKKLTEQCIQEKLDFLSDKINSYKVQLHKNEKA